MMASEDKYLEALSRIELLEDVFGHRFVSFNESDICNECGLDIRDDIHESIPEPEKMP